MKGARYVKEALRMKEAPCMKVVLCEGTHPAPLAVTPPPTWLNPHDPHGTPCFETGGTLH